ncbi:MAG TPA: tripartite tricarboxylate transporter substrate binding protein [Burkholderiaceae bacterium]|nr:tripartite tricarboxylate transporter substrate binding protein [Burkholderiaceae bacterium]
MPHPDLASDPIDPRRRQCLKALALAPAAAMLSEVARGQAAGQVVRLVVPFPGGNPVDALARSLAEALRQTTGRTYVVDNRPGAAGTIGSSDVARAKPDGTTLLFTTGGHLANAVLHSKMPYDVTRDFTPITQLQVSPGFVMLVRQDSRFKSVADVIREAKAKPGTISYGSWGAGNSTHVAGAMFARAAGIELLHVPYKGSPLQDFLGGHVDITWFSTLLSLQMIQEGKARALAVGYERRVPELPDVPTLAELGIRNADLPAWSALYGPPGMPGALVQAIHAEVVTASRQPAYLAAMKYAGTVVNMPPAQFARFNEEELARYRRDLTPLGISVD